jgi:hypothetical protein
MNAADRNRWRNTVDRVGDFVGRFQLAIMLAACVLLVGYCAGFHGRRSGRDEAAAVMRAALADSSRVIEQRVDARYQAIAFAENASANARAIHQTARTKITVVSDTVVRIDTALVEVPREIVKVIQASDSVIATQDVQIDLLTAQVRDLADDRDVWKRRAMVDETELRHRSSSRFGMKSGFVLGVASVAAVVWLVK